jgi:hypothetical protein
MELFPSRYGVIYQNTTIRIIIYLSDEVHSTCLPSEAVVITGTTKSQPIANISSSTTTLISQQHFPADMHFNINNTAMVPYRIVPSQSTSWHTKKSARWHWEATQCDGPITYEAIYAIIKEYTRMKTGGYLTINSLILDNKYKLLK